MIRLFRSQAPVPGGSPSPRAGPKVPRSRSGEPTPRWPSACNHCPGPGNNVGFRGAHAWAGEGPGRPSSAAPRNKRHRWAWTRRPAGKTRGKLCGALGRGGEARGPLRHDARHNSPAERGKAGRHAPAPPGPGSAAYLVVVLPATRGRRRPARAARHVHVQGAGEWAPQRPHPPRQPHGRQAQAQPAHEQSHRGPRPLAPITAGAGARRTCRRLQPQLPLPGIEPSRPTCPSSPF